MQLRSVRLGKEQGVVKTVELDVPARYILVYNPTPNPLWINVGRLAIPSASSYDLAFQAQITPQRVETYSRWYGLQLSAVVTDGSQTFYAVVSFFS